MRFKKTIIILSALVLLVLLFSKHFFVNNRHNDNLLSHIGVRLFELNTITVSVDDKIDIDKIILTSQIGDNIVFQNGQQRDKIKPVYGWCLFDFIYDGKLIATIGHNKHNNWHTNDYFFKVEDVNGEPNITLKLEGPDKKRELFKKEFIRDNNDVIVQTNYYNAIDTLYHREINN